MLNKKIIPRIHQRVFYGGFQGYTYFYFSVPSFDKYRLSFFTFYVYVNGNSIAQLFESNVYRVSLSFCDVDNSHIEFTCVFDILVSSPFTRNYVKYDILKSLVADYYKSSVHICIVRHNAAIHIIVYYICNESR